MGSVYCGMAKNSTQMRMLMENLLSVGNELREDMGAIGIDWASKMSRQELMEPLTLTVLKYVEYLGDA